MTQSTADTKATDAMSPLPTPKERRRLREAKDLSEAQVAATVGVTRATVRSWETGRTTPRGRKGQIYARFLASIASELAAAANPDATGPRSSRPAGSTATPPATPGTPATPAAPHAPSTPGPSPTPSPADATAKGDTGSEHVGAGAEASCAVAADPAPGGAVTTPLSTPQGDEATATEPHAPRTDTPRGAEAAATEPHAPRTDTPRGAEAAATEPHAPPPRTPRAGEAADAEPGALTPAQAFDALYLAAAPALAQQTYLLTGRTRLARESVERAFHLAWEHWPQVATDRDPVGWVRAAAHEYALSPWHRFRRTHKHPDQPPVEPERRALLDTLLDLPPAYRRTALLYDGLGLDLPDAAAEMEASTPAAASRVLNARAALVDRVPAARRAKTPEALSSVLRERITDLALAGPPALTRLPSARVVRTGGERRRRFWTRSAIAFTTLIVSATSFTVVTVPHHHVRPVPLGVRVGGVPVNSGPQRLTSEDLELRDKLRTEPARGPHRLVLDIR
ncbi:helix-turn-helix domain-containing protein [Streptomyces hundungensis]|uniref:helix-turn-helix domain-containing protein n=1 Tax=Streptomyces hundungensis TaxID=1077946 RepID=UPI0033C28F60